MIITLIFLIMMWSLIGGAVGKSVNQIGASKCNNKKGCSWEDCGHYYTGVMSGVFWPIALPASIGMKASAAVPTEGNKEVEAEKKRQAELKNIQHEAELEQAELMRDEMLNRRLALQARTMETEVKILELESRGAHRPTDSEMNF